MSTIALNCLVSGDGPGKIFTVEIPSDKNVSILKDLIKEKAHPDFSSVAARNIQLFKLKVSLAPDEASGVSDPLQNDAVEELSSPLAKISAIFKDLPDDKVHVIVLAPTVTLKRSASPLPLQHDLLKRAKLAQEVPSQVARSPNYKSLQADPFQKILDDRPSPDADIAPIALLYHGFGRFEDVIACPKATLVEQFKPAVDKFAEAMSRFYPVEDQRRDAGLPLLNAIFAIRAEKMIPSLSAAAIGSVRSDGHSVDRHGMVNTVVELKNELAGISSIPHVEVVAYAAHAHARIDGTQRLLEGWRVPCLGITIVGFEVRFYAIILLGHQYRVVSLTPAFSCLQSASSGKEREALYSAFAAASELQACILADVELHLKTPPPPIPNGAYRLPAVSKLRKHGPGSSGYIEFEIEEYYPSRQSYRQLYNARVRSGGDAILVKFSRTYCIELHDYCFEQGHAPRILGFEHLPGGWYGIAMEYLSGASPIKSVQLGPQLRELVNGFHEQGLVHGDLRDANILSDGREQFWLIDFDWGGKDGEVEYPTSDLNPDLLAGRTTGDLKIRRADDIRILDNMLHNLQDSHVPH